MSFFNKIFGDKNEESSSQKSFWKPINTEEDLANAIELSNQRKIAIFKHSTSCFISKTVLKNFEKEVEVGNEENYTLFYLDLLAHRNLSNAIAEQLGIRHESPQLLVIENGKVVSHASHQDISLDLI
ncbi:bacillithiol system redox-active protein YtxJ [Chryseobacterium sp.]|uniref:bacillithiol system redox-active protein YtxJ n=1 Tax=Chryseobacterium sp. TaxID=1871047 RepID=UPI00388E28B0